MSAGHQVDVERVVDGMINDSPEMQRRYHTSASFRHGVQMLARLLGPWVEGMAGQADEADAQRDALMRAALGTIDMGRHPLTPEDGR